MPGSGVAALYYNSVFNFAIARLFYKWPCYFISLTAAYEGSLVSNPCQCLFLAGFFILANPNIVVLLDVLVPSNVRSIFNAVDHFSRELSIPIF